MEENYITHILPNGARIVLEHVPAVRSASLGIWVGSGSRHERKDQNGAAHFIEHMVFKGTQRRSARELAQEMDCTAWRSTSSAISKALAKVIF